ncbi:hypothetical protein K439DRAFT_1623818 [Ramaria rubella]|nr:hypothetical protein K439DRAFT_1623818 [Ramaria rubella]
MPAAPAAFLALLAPSMHLNTPLRLMGTTAAMLASSRLLCTLLPPSWVPVHPVCSPATLLATSLSSVLPHHPPSSPPLLHHPPSPSMHPTTLLGPTAPSGHSRYPDCPVPLVCTTAALLGPCMPSAHSRHPPGHFCAFCAPSPPYLALPRPLRTPTMLLTPSAVLCAPLPTS